MKKILLLLTVAVLALGSFQRLRLANTSPVHLARPPQMP
jgi:hypothetical protein